MQFHAHFLLKSDNLKDLKRMMQHRCNLQLAFFFFQPKPLYLMLCETSNYHASLNNFYPWVGVSLGIGPSCLLSNTFRMFAKKGRTFAHRVFQPIICIRQIRGNKN